MMESENNITGQFGGVSMTVEITRKDTGKTEYFELIGTITEDLEDVIESFNERT